MEEDEIKALVQYAFGVLRLSLTVLILVGVIMVGIFISPESFKFGKKIEAVVEIPTEEDRDRIENGIHLRTGLVEADGMFVVIANCTNCHSAKLVTQNRMTAERWNETIKWMQETQNLWDLGENQEVIVNYLVTNYPPAKSGGRRANLADIDWYEMEE